MYWPADGEATRFRKGETLRLRYRVLVFSGEPKAHDLAVLCGVRVGEVRPRPPARVDAVAVVTVLARGFSPVCG